MTPDWLSERTQTEAETVAQERITQYAREREERLAEYRRTWEVRWAKERQRAASNVSTASLWKVQ